MKFFLDTANLDELKKGASSARDASKNESPSSMVLGS